MTVLAFSCPEEPLGISATPESRFCEFGWELFSFGDESTQAQLRVPWLVLYSPEYAKVLGHNWDGTSKPLVLFY